MASIFKAKGAKRYTILYFDENGDRRNEAGATDKAVTQRIVNELENCVALRREGLIDPAAERFAECERRPIGEHLDDFIATMEARNCDPKHMRTTRTYIQRIIDQAGVARLLRSHPVRRGTGRRADPERAWSFRSRRQRPHDCRQSLRELGEGGQSNPGARIGEHRPSSEDADRRYIRRPMTAGGVADPDRLGPDRSRVEGDQRRGSQHVLSPGCHDRFPADGDGIAPARRLRPRRADADRPPGCFQDEERQVCRTTHPGEAGRRAASRGLPSKPPGAPCSPCRRRPP